MEHPFLTKHYQNPAYKTLKGYLSLKGYESLKKALTQKPSDVVHTVKDSGLRGRGGAGFPTGVKWGFLPSNGEDRYLLCNADEGEPGTFKDRWIMEKAPHQLIEGMLIAAYAIQSHKSYIYIRGEYQECIGVMEQALKEAYKGGYLGPKVCGSDFRHDMDIYVGAGAYICGEETGMISSLEGKKGQPKLKPPFPAVKGYLEKPTIVNNVETLACLVPLLKDGGREFKKIGTSKSPGTKLFSVSGCVRRPGNYEMALGCPLMDLIEQAGGLKEGRKLKAVIPGGSSAAVLTAEECLKAKMDFETLSEMGTMLGSGAVIVIDDSQSMVDLLTVIMKFYHHESCGQCTPCREGTGWLHKVVEDIFKGRGRMADLDLIVGISENMMGRTICALSDAAALPAISFVARFREEFEDRIQKGSSLHKPLAG